MGRIKPAQQFVEGGGHVHGVHRRRNNDGAVQHLPRGFSLLTQPFRQHIAAQGNPDGETGPVRVAVLEFMHNKLRVLRAAQVVQFCRAVHIKAARTEKHDHKVPAQALELFRVAGNVIGPVGPLHAVK